MQFALLRWDDVQILPFFFNETIWLAHCPKRINLWRFPNIEDSILKYVFHYHWLTYRGEMRITFVIGNMLWNTLRNWVIYWEPIWNLMGTQWEHIQNERSKIKISPPSPHPKKSRTLVCMHVISIPKTGYHYFLAPKRALSNTR